MLHALIFGFLDFRTGQLDPGYAALAREACISIRSVARGLQNLKLAGCSIGCGGCAEGWKDGRFMLEQETNAYAILPGLSVARLSGTTRSAAATARHMGRSPVRHARPVDRGRHRAAPRQRPGGGYPAA